MQAVLLFWSHHEIPHQQPESKGENTRAMHMCTVLLWIADAQACKAASGFTHIEYSYRNQVSARMIHVMLSMCIAASLNQRRTRHRPSCEAYGDFTASPTPHPSSASRSPASQHRSLLCFNTCTHTHTHTQTQLWLCAQCDWQARLRLVPVRVCCR